jgi:hypothetical protein
MWNKITFIVLFVLSAIALPAQNSDKKNNVINYLNSQEHLDPIEGIWTLHVVRTLYQGKDSVTQETQYMRSEWAIIKINKNKFQVIDIGSAENEKGATDFIAYFLKTNTKGNYIYKCNFLKPKWKAKALATLTDSNILQYEYFVDKIYLIEDNPVNYKHGQRLRWQFTWTKKSDNQ